MKNNIELESLKVIANKIPVLKQSSRNRQAFWKKAENGLLPDLKSLQQSTNTVPPKATQDLGCG